MIMAHSIPGRLLLGITGGIAAYKTAELVRLLVKQGTTVQVVMTEAACRFITPLTLQALSGQPVATSLWHGDGNGMAHIELARNADAILIAPASADFIASLAQGHATDLLSTLCLARGHCPLLLAPAMNPEMWDNPATRRNVAQLAGDGVHYLGPETGAQACGETGLGRMAEPQDILDAMIAALTPKRLAGKKIMVTAGPTFEALDPVRGLTNLSSGKMGYAIARAAQDMGAQVTLVSGPTALPAPPGVTRIDVISARQMQEAVMTHIAGQDIFIAVAAVADYGVAHPATHKIKKSAAPLTLELIPNPDILDTVTALPHPPFCVGFALESNRLQPHAEQKRQRKRLPLLAANLVNEALGQDDSALLLLDDQGAHPLPRAPKSVLAHQLLEHITTLLPLSGDFHG